MKWRVLDLEGSAAYSNMAIDEALTMTVGAKKSPPTIRFYKWKPSAISLGYYQKAEDVNLNVCKQLGFDCVRRMTGGMAVFHDSADLTYSVVAPASKFPKDILKTYNIICNWFLDGLKALGLKGVIEGNNILVKGRKISGNAQARINGAVLQQGTLVYKLDVDKTAVLLNLEDKQDIVAGQVTSVFEHKEMTFKELYEAFKKSFLKDKDFEYGKLTDEERKLVQKLLGEKYLTDKWNLKGEGKEKGPCYVNLD